MGVFLRVLSCDSDAAGDAKINQAGVWHTPHFELAIPHMCSRNNIHEGRDQEYVGKIGEGKKNKKSFPMLTVLLVKILIFDRLSSSRFSSPFFPSFPLHQPSRAGAGCAGHVEEPWLGPGCPALENLDWRTWRCL